MSNRIRLIVSIIYTLALIVIASNVPAVRSFVIETSERSAFESDR